MVVWNFPQFIVIHTVKGFSVVNKAEIEASTSVEVYLEFLALSKIQRMLAI